MREFSPKEVFKELGFNSEMMDCISYGQEFIDANWPTELLGDLLHIGILRFEKPRQGNDGSYSVDLNVLGRFTAESLRLHEKPRTVVPDRLWYLGNRPKQSSFGQVFMVRGIGEEWPDAPRIFSSLTEEATGLCLGMGYDLPRPNWIPKGLCFVSLLNQLRFTHEKVWLELRQIEERIEKHRRAHRSYLREQGESVSDDQGNAMPSKLKCSGNLALQNKPLMQIWREYLDPMKPERRIEIIERESRDLDWSQNQRAAFIGMDKAQYSRKKPKNQPD